MSGRAPRDVLIVRAGALGDVLLTLPALHLLRAHHPDARIRAVGYPDIWRVAGDIVDERLSIDAPLFAGLFAGRPAPGLVDLLRDVEAIAWISRPPNPALADNGVSIVHASPYPPPGVHAAAWLMQALDCGEDAAAYAGRSSMGTWLANSDMVSPARPGQPRGDCPYRIGGRGIVPTPNGKRQWHIGMCRSPATTVGDVPRCRPRPRRPTLVPYRERALSPLPGIPDPAPVTRPTPTHALLDLTSEEIDAGRRVLDDLSLRRPVFLHPGAGARWKCWPAERFAAVARTLTERRIEMALIEGPADREDVRVVLDMTGRLLPVLRDLPLRVLAGALSHGETYLGNDSGVTHLAAMAGARTIALFGPTDPASWAPIGDVRVIRACTAQTTRRGQIRVCDDPTCMDAITVEQVLSAMPRAMRSTQDQ